MLRLFVAARPPAPVRDALLDIMDDVPEARWQDEDQLHLTLRFIGEVERPVAEDVALALASVRAPPLELAFEGVGAFARRGRTESIWAGVAPHEGLTALHRKVDQAVAGIGLPPERRAYRPHVTLARFGRRAGDVAPFIRAHLGFASERFTLDAFGLYESHLGRHGASYMELRTYPLG